LEAEDEEEDDDEDILTKIIEMNESSKWWKNQMNI
jgi:hypothetical protein